MYLRVCVCMNVVCALILFVAFSHMQRAIAFGLQSVCVCSSILYQLVHPLSTMLDVLF